MEAVDPKMPEERPLALFREDLIYVSFILPAQTW